MRWNIALHYHPDIIRHRTSSTSRFKGVAIEPFDTYCLVGSTILDL
jgi:hypothetical protein